MQCYHLKMLFDGLIVAELNVVPWQKYQGNVNHKIIPGKTMMDAFQTKHFFFNMSGKKSKDDGGLIEICVHRVEILGRSKTEPLGPAAKSNSKTIG